MIRLSQALDLMEKAEKPFHIRFATYDKSRNTGGKIIELANAIKTGARFNLKNNDMICVKAVDNSNHPYPVHIHLITEFNHTKVFY